MAAGNAGFRRDKADSIRFNAPDQTHRRIGRDKRLIATRLQAGRRFRLAVARNHMLAIPLCTLSGFKGIQVAQEQFADWRIASMH